MRRHATTVVVGCLVTVGAAVVLATALLRSDDSDAERHKDDPAGGVITDPRDYRQISRDRPYQPPTDEQGNIVLHNVQPGKIYRQLDPYLSSEIMWPLTNGWSVGNHYEITVVHAGQSASDPSTGMLVIWRTSTRDDAPSGLSAVEIPDSGIVRITKAPLGRSVVGWAPYRAAIEFKGARGVTGTLHLTDDSVTLDRGSP